MNYPPLPPAPPVPSRPTVNGLAITSLVLGLCFMVCGPFTSIPAIIVGILALSRIRRSGGAQTGEGLAIAGIAVGSVGMLLMLPIMVAIFLPAVMRAREAANRASCQNNLKEIGASIQEYRDDHGGIYPDSMAELYPQYVSDLQTFICPTDGDAVAGAPEDADDWSSYEYVGGEPDVEPGVPESEIPIAEDKHTEHVPRGYNVLYADGHVEFVRDET